MSKFDEMCAAYTMSRKNYFEYQKRCLKHFDTLIKGFIKYCDIPKEQVRFEPCDKVPEKNARYTLIGSIHLNDDTFWHLGMVITLYEKPNVYPHQSLLIILCIKENNGKVFLKVTPEDKQQQIDLLDEKQCSALYDRLIEGVKSYYQNGLQRFLKGPESIKKIGFH